MLVGWAVILVLAAVSDIGTLAVSEHPVEVDSGEYAVLWDHVILGGGFESVQVLEAGGVSLTKDVGHKGVAVVDAVDVVALEELKHIVLDNGVLCDSGAHSTGGLETDSVTKSEDVVEALMLESVLVDVDQSLAVSDTGILNPLVSP